MLVLQLHRVSVATSSCFLPLPREFTALFQNLSEVRMHANWNLTSVSLARVVCDRCLILSASVVSVRSFAVDQRLKMHPEHLLEVKSLHKAFSQHTSIHHIFPRYSEWKDRPTIHCRGFGVRYHSLSIDSESRKQHMRRLSLQSLLD